MNVTNFSVRGLSTNATAGFLSASSGTLKISGNNTFSGTLSSFAPFSLGSNVQLWFNNPNFTILGQAGDVSVLGAIRMSQGVFNIGTTINNILNMSGANSYLYIDGGEINIAGICSTFLTTYEQRGGVVNVCTVGNNSSFAPSFSLQSGSTFIMTDGMLRLVKANSNASAISRTDYSNLATANTILGGKLVLGKVGETTSIGGFVNFYALGNMPNVELSGGIPNLILNSKNDIDVFGNITIPVNGRIVSGSVSLRVNDGTLTNNGSIFIPASSSGGLFFTGKGAAGCTYKGTGQAVSNANEISRVIVDHPVGLTIDPATVNNLVTTNFFLQRGNVFGANKITIGNNNSATISIGSASGLEAAGNFDVSPTFNTGLGTLGLTYLGPSLSRNTGKEIPPSRIVYNLTLSNGGAPLTVTGGNLQVTNNLTFTTGNINMNGDTLTLGNSPSSPSLLTLTSSSSVIYNGKFRRWMPNNNGTVRQFPVGISGIKRNLAITYTTLPTTGGTLTAEWVAAPGGAIGLPLTEGALPINSTITEGYWRMTAADGLSGGVFTATATAQQVTGVNDFTQTVLVKRADNASPWLLDGTHVTTFGSNTSLTLSRTGLVGFGEFAVGLPNVSTPLTTTWTGALSTAWEDAGNWSDGIPSAITGATIPSGRPRYPIINVSTSVKSISIADGASVTTATSVVVTITGN